MYSNNRYVVYNGYNGFKSGILYSMDVYSGHYGKNHERGFIDGKADFV